MKKEQICISTIDARAASVAHGYGMGLEIAQYCTAWNMDAQFEKTNAEVKAQLACADSRVLHAPFNELFPCAIDPEAAALAARRYRRAAELAADYGAEKLVVHGGFQPYMYYPQWYVEQSIRFWKDFLREAPPVQIVLENVLESEPQGLIDIVRTVDDPRLRLCLDIGHVNAYSGVSVGQWLRQSGAWITHFHLHNNDGSRDAHEALTDGSIDMPRFLAEADALCPEATYTLELTDSEPSVKWLLESGICK